MEHAPFFIVFCWRVLKALIPLIPLFCLQDEDTLQLEKSEQNYCFFSHLAVSLQQWYGFAASSRHFGKIEVLCALVIWKPQDQM